MKRPTTIIIAAIATSFFASAQTQAQTQNPHFFEPVFSIKLSQETSVFNQNYVEGNAARGHRDYNAIDRRLSDQSRKVKNRKRIDISNPRKGLFFKLP